MAFFLSGMEMGRQSCTRLFLTMFIALFIATSAGLEQDLKYASGMKKQVVAYENEHGE